MNNVYKTTMSVNNPDPDWDEFVMNDPMGQYQQTTHWSCAKLSEGWSYVRFTIYDRGGHMAGGFQLSSKRVWRCMNVGYISKGPLYKEQDDNLFYALNKEISKYVVLNKIDVLIIQTPDKDVGFYKYLLKNKYNDNTVIDMSSATSVIDMRQSIDIIFRYVNPSRKRDIKKATNNDMNFSVGSRSDLSVFYDLMLKSCKRISKKPNISSLDALYHMWDALSAAGMMNVFLVSHENNIITSLLTITYKNILYFWRFGWSGEYSNLQPNAFIYWETIKWAKDNGYSFVDLGGINRDVALSYKNKSQFPKNNVSSLFKIKFGGDIIIMSNTLIYFRNRFINYIYGKINYSEALRYIKKILN